MPQSLVVIVIPNWNLKYDLGECLNSLRSTSYQNQQVVIVDNGSTDGSLQFITDHYPDFHLIQLNTNLGYAGALNKGIEFALSLQASYVLALNNDTLVDLDAIKHLVEVMENDLTIGIAAPKILYYDHPEIIYSLGDLIHPLLPVPISVGRKHHDNIKYSGIMEFDYVTGCAMLIRADLFRKIGLFDPTYFMYYEDSDFCRRARDRSYKIVCVGNAKIFHKASLSSKKEKPLITRIRARNRIRFYRRYKHGLHPVLTYLVILFMAFWRSGGYIIHREGGLVKYYLQGLFEGIREKNLAQMPFSVSENITGKNESG